MTVKQQLIERFIRTKTPFNITISTNHTLCINPHVQNAYDGISLKAQTGFPNIQVSEPALVSWYDTKLIKKTSFKSDEERFQEIDRILKESGYGYQHRQNEKLVEELSNYLDELNNSSSKEIDYHDIKLDEINSIGIYGDDLISMYSIWNNGFDNIILNQNIKQPLEINDSINNTQLIDTIFKFALLNFTDRWYFKANLDVVKSSYKLSKKDLENNMIFTNPFSLKLAQKYYIKDRYLILHNYEIYEDINIDILIIPLNAITTFGYLRAHGGAMVQLGYSKMPERQRMKRMYVVRGVDISYNKRQNMLDDKDKEWILRNMN